MSGIKISAAVLCFLTVSAFAEEAPLSPRPDLIRVRHLESKGIGFNQGYSSLDLFISMPQGTTNLLPFVDLRGHIFNNGKCAANGGVGLRWKSEELKRVFGGNIYYDYRRTSKKNYNQISAGFEALGIEWDFRANGYYAVGGKRSTPFDFEYDFFPDNSFLLTANRETAMSGVDAEAGYHFSKIGQTELYTAFGPYFYTAGKWAENTFGVRARLEATFYKYLSLEAIASCDNVFHWIGQGVLSINIPFGHRRHDSKQESPRQKRFSRKTPPQKVVRDTALEERLYQPVFHNEIIVAQDHRRRI